MRAIRRRRAPAPSIPPSPHRLLRAVASLVALILSARRRRECPAGGDGRRGRGAPRAGRSALVLAERHHPASHRAVRRRHGRAPRHDHLGIAGRRVRHPAAVRPRISARSTSPRPTSRAACAATAPTSSPSTTGGRSQPLNAEILIPPKRAEYFPGNASSALSDDGRFIAVFNLTPMTSLSIVDVRARTLRRRGGDARLQPGLRRRPAALLHAVRERRGAGGHARRVRRQPTVARTARVLRSAEGSDHREGRAPRQRVALRLVRRHGPPDRRVGRRASLGEPWPLFDDADRQRLVAHRRRAACSPLHAPTGRLYVLVHQGGPDTHKEAGHGGLGLRPRDAASACSASRC